MSIYFALISDLSLTSCDPPLVLFQPSSVSWNCFGLRGFTL